MSDGNLVWSDEHGDLRKKKVKAGDDAVDELALVFEIRRVTSGKGRAVIEIKGLPNNKKWCQKLSKELKKKLGVGGAYKNDYIEVHGEKLDEVMQFFSDKSYKFKKTGG